MGIKAKVAPSCSILSQKHDDLDELDIIRSPFIQNAQSIFELKKVPSFLWGKRDFFSLLMYVCVFVCLCVGNKQDMMEIRLNIKWHRDLM